MFCASFVSESNERHRIWNKQLWRHPRTKGHARIQAIVNVTILQILRKKYFALSEYFSNIAQWRRAILWHFWWQFLNYWWSIFPKKVLHQDFAPHELWLFLSGRWETLSCVCMERFIGPQSRYRSRYLRPWFLYLQVRRTYRTVKQRFYYEMVENLYAGPSMQH